MRRVGKRVRHAVLSRQHWKCAICQSTLSDVFDIDHIVPWAISQSSEYRNLQALCVECHARKSRTEKARMDAFFITPFCWKCSSKCVILTSGVCEPCRIANTPKALLRIEEFAFSEANCDV